MILFCCFSSSIRSPVLNSVDDILRSAWGRHRFCAALAVTMLGLASPVAAQQPSAAEVSAALQVQAQVVPGLSMTLERGLDFGQVTIGDGTVSISRMSPQSGKCVVDGLASGTVTVQFIEPENGQLVRREGEGHLGLDLQIYGHDEDRPANASRLQDGDAVVLGDDGRYNFFVQGDLEVGRAEQNPAGAYTGALTMVVTYQ